MNLFHVTYVWKFTILVYQDYSFFQMFSEITESTKIYIKWNQHHWQKIDLRLGKPAENVQ